MTLSEFRERLRGLPSERFEDFVIDVLRDSRRFSGVKRHDVPRGASFVVDIEAVERKPGVGPPTTWLFEVKAMDLVIAESAALASYVLGAVRHQRGGPVRIALVVRGSLTAEAARIAQKEGLEVWDATKLAQLASTGVVRRYFGATLKLRAHAASVKAEMESLARLLDQLKPGKRFAIAYQKLVLDIFKFLFCPPLEMPRYEMPDRDKRNRRDMIFENAASSGFWKRIREAYSAHYIVVDAKNYSAPLTKRPVLDIAHYLKPYGCGLFGILVSRRGAGASAEHAVREQWIGAQKMIVVVSDDELVEMLKVKGEGGTPDETIRNSIASFRMRL